MELLLERSFNWRECWSGIYCMMLFLLFRQESQLAEKEKTMENWRQERDTLVAALEVQLKRLLYSQAEKDKLIQQLQQNNTQPPQEVSIT